MSILDKLNVAKFSVQASLARRGPWQTVRMTAFKLWYEWRLGVRTGQVMRTAEMDFADPEVQKSAREHWPAAHGIVHDVLKQVDCKGRGFVDYGSGSGRALLVAATFPFSRIIGVEASPSLAALSKASLEQYYAHRAGPRAPKWEIIADDARTFDPPDDVSIFYFFDPFGDVIFAPVLERIEASLRRAPREGVFLFLPYHDDTREAYRARLAAHGWVERPSPSREFQIYVLAAQR